MHKPFLVAVAAIAAVLSGSALYADNFPSRPVTFTAVFGPGSASDTICRIIADPLGQALKQPVVVKDRPGADGALLDTRQFRGKRPGTQQDAELICGFDGEVAGDLPLPADDGSGNHVRHRGRLSMMFMCIPNPVMKNKDRAGRTPTRIHY